MSEPIEGDYFNWLCAKVLKPGVRQYRDLLKILYSTEFVWIIPGDRNREEDGIELRQYFLNETGWIIDDGWYNEPCSVFEMLIAFSQRASFQTDIPTDVWFWEFMDNLDLRDYRHVNHSIIPLIDEILHDFVWRTYDPSGLGGICPLRMKRRDMRKVEIWYQFCEYLDDRAMI